MTVVYRDAGPADAELLARLGRETFTETFGHLYSKENLAAFLESHEVGRWRAELADPAFSVRLAEEDGCAAAYAKVGPPTLPFETRRAATELRQFYVLDRWHGRGVARELMAWVLAEAGRRGAEELYLSVFVDNHRARRFYARYGFEQVGTYDFMVGTHADLDLVMRLNLEHARVA
ncbi:MAG TPA: GNAT family N-acetyltransferase [Allosphingosinicella sp.]|jgi:ribosomal protein S18 acetylase RimI-like enzyme